jgi:sugar-specific transcriptional regulator TrmB
MKKEEIVLEELENRTLRRLGLSPLQTKIYLTLIQYGRLNSKAISKISNISQPDVYRIMVSLQKLGLVQRIVSTPVMFEVSPTEQAIPELLEEKMNEIINLGEETSSLIEALNGRINANIFKKHEVESEMTLIPPTKAVLSKRIKLMHNAKKSIDIVYTWKRFKQFFPFIVEPITKALERGVRLRLIIENASKITPTPEQKRFFRAIGSRGSAVKFSYAHPSAVISIFDRKHLLMSMSSVAAPFEAPVLTSNNSGLVSMATAYFECMWSNTKEAQ